MIKFKLYFDKDKETAWLNELSQKGYAMTGFFAGFYHFEQCEPGKYVYQIDFGDRLWSVSNEYREFMTEMDVEIVQCWGFWIILRKKATDGAFELYTDVDSMITHYAKILMMFKIVTIIELICFYMEIFAAMSGFPYGIFLALIIAVFVIAFLKISLHTKAVIRKLKERKGESLAKDNPRVSRSLMAGMFLNLTALLIESPTLTPVRTVIQIFAIILMLYGLYQSRSILKN